MQVQLNLLFDPSEQAGLANKLEQILLVAGVQTVLQLNKSSSDKDPDELKAQRQAQAANARAAKVAKQAQPAGPTRVSGAIAQAPADDVLGTNGQDQEDEDMGLDAPTSMSPGEAKDAALALVREVYSAGHVAEVKTLQKALNVAKFYDVPVSDGHSLYARVMRLAQSTGLRQ